MKPFKFKYLLRNFYLKFKPATSHTKNIIFIIRLKTSSKISNSCTLFDEREQENNKNEIEIKI